MITYVTYREATFKSMAALGAAREQAEAAGWFVSTIQRNGNGARVLFGFEQAGDPAGASVRPELPEFRPLEERPAVVRSLVAGVRSRLGHAFHGSRKRDPLVPQVRPSLPHRR